MVMEWELLHGGLPGADQLRDSIDVRLRLALGRHRRVVSSVVVVLHGGRDLGAGIDKSCRIRARVRNAGDIFALVVDSDWETAIERACQRIGQSVGREIERVRRLPRPAPVGTASAPASEERTPQLPEA
jgi:hypothetical protein